MKIYRITILAFYFVCAFATINLVHAIDPEGKYYETLGLNEHATQKEIVDAYRKLSMKHHPDRNGTGERKTFQDIKEAYELLSVPEKREAYDKMIGVETSNAPKEIHDFFSKDIEKPDFGSIKSIFAKKTSQSSEELKEMIRLRSKQVDWKNYSLTPKEWAFVAERLSTTTDKEEIIYIGSILSDKNWPQEIWKAFNTYYDQLAYGARLHWLSVAIETNEKWDPEFEAKVRSSFSSEQTNSKSLGAIRSEAEYRNLHYAEFELLQSREGELPEAAKKWFFSYFDSHYESPLARHAVSYLGHFRTKTWPPGTEEKLIENMEKIFQSGFFPNTIIDAFLTRDSLSPDVVKSLLKSLDDKNIDTNKVISIIFDLAKKFKIPPELSNRVALELPKTGFGTGFAKNIANFEFTDAKSWYAIKEAVLNNLSQRKPNIDAHILLLLNLGNGLSPEAQTERLLFLSEAIRDNYKLDSLPLILKILKDSPDWNDKVAQTFMESIRKLKSSELNDFFSGLHPDILQKYGYIFSKKEYWLGHNIPAELAALFPKPSLNIVAVTPEVSTTASSSFPLKSFCEKLFGLIK